MGKKMRKKTRNVHKEKRVSSVSPRTVNKYLNPTVEIVGQGGDSAVKERKPCNHIDKSVDVDKISSRIGSLDIIKCDDCRDISSDRRVGKERGKQGKKKGIGSVGWELEPKRIWVCLVCGHFACGGEAFGDLTAQSHAYRHAKHTRHPCVVQFENPLSFWCFTCNSLIPVEKSKENGDADYEILSHVTRLIEAHSMEGAVMDAEDVWFGRKSEDEKSLENGDPAVFNVRGYMVRGLLNLGNTCFFNSVMQNLFAMDMLRGYFMIVDQSVGPLTASLKKLFHETGVDADSKNGLNPKTFFGCICSKAPQFRGYQQQDSHELLRYLLDGLQSEEFSMRKSLISSSEEEVNSNSSATFVDEIFGGQLSSTVCCLECGHSSTVYEPFLDLSLPVPTKKPPSKKAAPVSQPKKTKLPQGNKGRRNQEKWKKHETAPVLAQTVTVNVSFPSESSCSRQSSVHVSEQMGAIVDEFSWLDYIGPPVSEQTGAMVDEFSWLDYIGPPVSEQTGATVDEFSWLDYIGPDTESEDIHSVIPNLDSPVVQDTENGQVFQNDDIRQCSSELQGNSCSLNKEPKMGPKSSGENFCGDEIPLLVRDSEVLLLPYKEETSTTEEMVGSAGGGRNPANISIDAPSMDFSPGTSSTVIGHEQSEPDFDGFGDLFNEPATVSDSKTESGLGNESFQANEEMETALFGGNSSESNQDEVDNTAAQVSVDSCLAYFTKPELLSNEHAWHCEKCSKQCRKVNPRHGKGKAVDRNDLSKGRKLSRAGGEVRRKKASTGLDEDSTNSTGSKILDNGKLSTDASSSSNAESSGSHLERVNDEEVRPCGGTNCGTCEFAQARNGKALEFLNPLSNCLAQFPEDSQRPQDLPSTSDHNSTGFQVNLGVEAINSCTGNEPNSIASNDYLNMQVLAAASGCSVNESETILPSSSEFDQVQQKDSQLSGRVNQSDDSGSEEMDSESRKVKRDATKNILINKAPPILTIHLKRFGQDARGRLNKLSGHVSFRDTLDLRPYMDPRCGETDKCCYHLVGAVEHSGTMRGGHYVAYIKGAKTRGKTEKGGRSSAWFYASDSHVREVSLTEVLQCEAYILFYEKCNVHGSA